MQKRNRTDHIIIHHSATARDTTRFESIKRYHIQTLGWDNIGYHCVIEGDGSIRRGMPENMVGYHCKYGGYNFKAVGVCLTGNFCRDQESPSDAQLRSLGKVLGEWRSKYNVPKSKISGHRETGAATACPGRNLLSWLENYRRGGDDALTDKDKKWIRNKMEGKLDKDNYREDTKKLKSWIMKQIASASPDAVLTPEMRDELLEGVATLNSLLKDPETGLDAVRAKVNDIADKTKGLGDLKESIRNLQGEIKVIKGKLEQSGIVVGDFGILDRLLFEVGELWKAVVKVIKGGGGNKNG